MTETLAHGTKNFKVLEFACKCGRFDCPHYGVKQELIEALQKLRDLIGEAIFVNSGYRCPWWNAKQGGTKNSMISRVDLEKREFEYLTPYAAKAAESWA